ncbi:MAG: MarR family transcriptional regulator [Planctomycetota bacterium]|nr:MarR family transcriptional regulator [Planctomycetota bacterium]
MNPDRKRPPAATTEATFRSLLRVYGLLKRAMEPYFAPFGITGSQWGMLRILERAENEGLSGLRLTDLGGSLLVRPPSITGVVSRLEHLGLVARSASAADLRAKHVNLTPAGRRLIKRMRPSHSARVRAVLAGLGLRDQDLLIEHLDRLAAHLEGLVEQEDGPTPAQRPARRRRR